MGSDESHFNVWLTVRDKVTRQCPQTTTFEEKGQSRRTGFEPRSLCLPAYNALQAARPNRHTQQKNSRQKLDWLNTLSTQSASRLALIIGREQATNLYRWYPSCTCLLCRMHCQIQTKIGQVNFHPVSRAARKVSANRMLELFPYCKRAHRQLTNRVFAPVRCKTCAWEMGRVVEWFRQFADSWRIVLLQWWTYDKVIKKWKTTTDADHNMPSM